ncbi:MAG TPA: hypothetical protein VHQ22_10400 [Terriglobales bacterium]|jgi:hypothetical protein|nr:hypothetical protein [Terriglobales bacterium]
MTYTKPELAILGDATLVIQSEKGVSIDPPNVTPGNGELDLGD